MRAFKKEDSYLLKYLCLNNIKELQYILLILDIEITTFKYYNITRTEKYFKD